MLTLSRRAFATVVFALLAMIASLTVAVTPAAAAYTPIFVCNRHRAHVGQAISCTLHHFPKSHHGSIQVTAKFRKTIHHRHHHVTHKWVRRTEVLDSFQTSHNGGRIVAFNIPRHIHRGNHVFHAVVGHAVKGAQIRVV